MKKKCRLNINKKLVVTIPVIVAVLTVCVFTVMTKVSAKEVNAYSDTQREYAEQVYSSITDETLAEKLGAQIIDDCVLAYSEDLEIMVYATAAEDISRSILVINTDRNIPLNERCYGLSITNREYVIFTFPASGEYNIQILDNSEGTSTVVISTLMTVEVTEDPWVKSSSYVVFDSNTYFCQEAVKIAERNDGDWDQIIQECQKTIANRIEYDYEECEANYAGNWSDLNETYTTGKGICIDYAAAMTAMLRYVGIPAKYIVGQVYSLDGELLGGHAWVEVLSSDGETWEIYDPTFYDSLRDDYSSSSYTYKMMMEF